jgi:hypothetical protein
MCSLGYPRLSVRVGSLRPWLENRQLALLLSVGRLAVSPQFDRPLAVQHRSPTWVSIDSKQYLKARYSKGRKRLSLFLRSGWVSSRSKLLSQLYDEVTIIAWELEGMRCLFMALSGHFATAEESLLLGAKQTLAVSSTPVDGGDRCSGHTSPFRIELFQNFCALLGQYRTDIRSNFP